VFSAVVKNFKHKIRMGTQLAGQPESTRDTLALPQWLVADRKLVVPIRSDCANQLRLKIPPESGVYRPKME
jgi:hypothetical protein